MKLDVYSVVVLWRPADAPTFTEEELDRLQEEHVAFNQRMRDEGHAVITGPVRGQPDESFRGINVFRTSVEETRRLMQSDASVRAGRLRADVFSWLIPAGLLGASPAAQIESE